MNKTPIKYLFISDLQIPDQNDAALEALYKFIPDFKADRLMIMGDFLNFTSVSSYTSPDYHIDLSDEIAVGREVLGKLVKLSRRANSRVEITWFDGNHEYRLMKFLAEHAGQIEGLELNGEKILSIQHIMEFKKLGIKYLPYLHNIEENGIILEHGDIARSKAGFTAHGMLDKRGLSGMSGHTHRLSYVSRSQSGRVKFWMEIGSFCNLNPTPRYGNMPDWQNGFAVGHYFPQTKTFHPTLIPIFDSGFEYAGKLYK